MDVDALNIALDIILVVAALWMIMSGRGIGGVVGRTMNYIVLGALITGLAHLFATISKGWFDEYDGAVHRLVVLVGFLFLAYGFHQLQAMKR